MTQFKALPSGLLITVVFNATNPSTGTTKANSATEYTVRTYKDSTLNYANFEVDRSEDTAFQVGSITSTDMITGFTIETGNVLDPLAAKWPGLAGFAGTAFTWEFNFYHTGTSPAALSTTNFILTFSLPENFVIGTPTCINAATGIIYK